MLFFNKSKPVEAKRYTAKRTEEVLEPMNLKALNSYAKNIENKKKHLDLLARLFSDEFTTEAANTTVARKAVNS